MGLMEQFSDPNLIDQLSLTEKLGGAGITTLMGMGITFIVLALLWLFLALMARIMTAKKKPEETPVAVAAVPEVPATAPVSAGEEEALVAVITAAIAAAEGRPTNQLVVRKISRVSGATTAWGLSGRTDCIESRKF